MERYIIPGTPVARDIYWHGNETSIAVRGRAAIIRLEIVDGGGGRLSTRFKRDNGKLLICIGKSDYMVAIYIIKPKLCLIILIHSYSQTQ